jgi:hypothetical protein
MSYEGYVLTSSGRRTCLEKSREDVQLIYGGGGGDQVRHRGTKSK